MSSRGTEIDFAIEKTSTEAKSIHVGFFGGAGRIALTFVSVYASENLKEKYRYHPLKIESSGIHLAEKSM